MDEKKPENSKVNVHIDLSKFNTGVDALDKHLATADFFDLSKNSEAEFISKKVEVNGKNQAKVYGDLKLKGVTKEVILDVTLNKLDVHPMIKKRAVGFFAVAQIKRSDFGINYALPAVGDEVDLNIQVEALLK